MKNTESINIGILCENFDEAIFFYVNFLEFDIKLNKKISVGSATIIRVILTHKTITQLEVEFIFPASKEDKNRLGIQGGTVNLFNLPTKKMDEIKNKLATTDSFLNYQETPYANFLELKDPMGNHIGLYEKI